MVTTARCFRYLTHIDRQCCLLIALKIVLAHPNVKVFISHGGLLSTIETIYHGVPILGIPIFGDQKMNLAVAAEKGYALSLPYGEVNEESLTKALQEILNNPK